MRPTMVLKVHACGLKVTYIDCGYALELAVGVYEARSICSERLFDARPGQLHCRLHQLMVVLIRVSLQL